VSPLLFFPEKPGDLFLVASSPVSPLTTFFCSSLGVIYKVGVTLAATDSVTLFFFKKVTTILVIVRSFFYKFSHFTADVAVDKEELVNSWSLEVIRIQIQEFLKYSSTLRDIFHNLDHIDAKPDRQWRH